MAGLQLTTWNELVVALEQIMTPDLSYLVFVFAELIPSQGREI